MIIYICFAVAFIVALDCLRQCGTVSMSKGRLIVTPNAKPLIIAGLIRMDETEAGISFELVGRRGGAK